MSNIINLLSNKLSIQSYCLEDLESRILNGNSIVDGNNVPTFMLETISTLVSELSNKNDKLIHSIYPLRAQTSNELYNHMNTWDYVGLFSSPADTKINLILDRDYLIKNAKDFNENYKKVIIPKNTVFTIGGLYFGIYYPIEIRINKFTETIIVSHNTNETNPLFNLVDNTVNFHIIQESGLNLLNIQIPIYQFKRTQIIEELIEGKGFKQSIEYIDKFYAIRAYHFKNNKWSELNQTLSSINYDPLSPTIKFSVEIENNKVNIEIPQIYFSNESIGSRLKLDIFTTKGELNITLNNISSGNINFELTEIESDEYEFVNILNKIPIINLYPGESNIIGGTNGYGFEELRDNIINKKFIKSVAVREDQIKNLFNNKNISVKLINDSLTKRIYLANSIIYNPSDTINNTSSKIYEPISTGLISTKIDINNIDNISTIKHNSDQSITILPSTIYKLNKDNVAIPLTDTEINSIYSMSDSNRVNLFNNDQYTFSPYHVRLIIRDQYPLSFIYDMLNPKINNIKFIKENIEISSQMIIRSGIIIHKLKENHKFIIRVGVIKSSDLLEVPNEDLIIRFWMWDDSRINRVYIDANKTPYYIDGDIHYYDVEFYTNYNINDNHSINITNTKDDRGLPIENIFINLETTISVEMFAKAKYLNDIDVIDTEEYIKMIDQEIDITLGNYLNESIFSNVDVTFSDTEYQTYFNDEPKTYPTDVYETDETGALVYTIVDGNIVLNKLYSAGDIVTDTYGSTLYNHRAGDYILDEYGNKIIKSNRNIEYNIDLIHLDNKILEPSNIDLNQIGIDISNQFKLFIYEVDKVQNQLLTQTYVYFKPKRTIGKAIFSTKNDINIEHDLNIYLSFIVYVDKNINKDTQIKESFKQVILNIINTNIQNGFISISDIQKQIRKELDDQIISIDTLGISGDPELQTLKCIDNDTQPILKQKLIYNSDQTLSLKPDLRLTFSPINMGE